MKKLTPSLILILFMGTWSIPGAEAQTTITFRLDMRPNIEDGTFKPEQDRIDLTGNQLPFTKTRNVKLKDRPPIDSIYVATLNFPSLTNNKVLRYNYIIVGNGKKNKKEDRPRLLQLNQQDSVLSITFFNNISQ